MTRLAALLVHASALALPALASAHPGHGGTAPDTLAHYAVEPLHAHVLLAALVAVVGLALGLGLRARRGPR